MRARLIAYLLCGGAGAVVAWVPHEWLLDQTAAARPIAYQTLAGAGAALFTVQLAVLAFFTVTGRGSRLRTVLVRSQGSGATSIASDSLVALCTAIGFGVLIIIDAIAGTAALVIGGALAALQLCVGANVAGVAYYVMLTLERDATDQARADYDAAGREFVDAG